MDSFNIDICPHKDDVELFISEVHEKLGGKLREVKLLNTLSIKTLIAGVEFIHNEGIRFIIPPNRLVLHKPSDVKEGDIELTQVLLDGILKEIEKKDIRVKISLRLGFPFEDYKKRLVPKLDGLPKFDDLEPVGVRYQDKTTTLIIDKTGLGVVLSVETKLSGITKDKSIIKLYESSGKILEAIKRW